MIFQYKLLLRSAGREMQKILPGIQRWLFENIKLSFRTRKSKPAAGCDIVQQDGELRAFYDLAVCPVTFDVANFLALAEVARLEMGCSHIRMIVVPAIGHGFRDLKVHSAEHSRHRIMSIIVPATKTLPSCIGISILTDRKSAENLVPEEGLPVFPPNYKLDRPTRCYTWRQTWEKVNEGKDIQSLRASELSLKQVDFWLSRCGLEDKKLAVITLREANYQEDRNNKLKEWGKFCSYLSEKGFQPLIIRDFDRSYEKLPNGLRDYPVCDLPNWDVGFRIALYERSNVCFFVNNGPWVFALFNADVHFLAVKMITESVRVTSTKFRIKMGDQIGSNYKFLKSYQRIVWENDDYSVLVRNFERYLEERVMGLEDVNVTH